MEEHNDNLDTIIGPDRTTGLHRLHSHAANLRTSAAEADAMLRKVKPAKPYRESAWPAWIIIAVLFAACFLANGGPNLPHGAH